MAKDTKFGKSVADNKPTDDDLGLANKLAADDKLNLVGEDGDVVKPDPSLAALADDDSDPENAKSVPPVHNPGEAPDGVTETTQDASLPVFNVPADEGLDELPEGAILAGPNPEDQLPENGAPVVQPLPVAAFSDEHVGVGGSYAMGDDGVRRPLYEEYYVPADNPGDPMVRKYRRVP